MKQHKKQKRSKKVALTSKAKLKKLQERWYSKLRRSGFVDLEDKRENLKEETAVRQHHEWTRAKYDLLSPTGRAAQNRTRLAAREQYYSVARQFLETYAHFGARDRRLWELHTEGLSYREICKRVKHKGKPAPRMRIFRRLRPFVIIMLSGHWQLKPTDVSSV